MDNRNERERCPYCGHKTEIYSTYNRYKKHYRIMQEYEVICPYCECVLGSFMEEVDE